MATSSTAQSPTAPARYESSALAQRIPPHAFFVASAVFHYLGPAFAVLLFAYVAPLGVAWLRIAVAAAIFALWRRPWRFFRQLNSSQRAAVISLGLVLAAMNCVFYEAIARLPLGTVGAIEFLGPVGLAVVGMRTRRNFAAFVLAVAGVAVLTDVRIVGEPVGYAFAFANCAAFVLYVVLGHRIAADGGVAGIDRLGTAMLVAAITALPFGVGDAVPALTSPLLLGAAVGVGVTSSVIPYVCDQLAMARLPRASFALMLALLPATAAAIGVVVLRQVPSGAELCGIALVVAGVGLHRP
ncbi:MAG TPA: EamA family transporter [Xanthobacteraceae bacterium]|nr:EamA family transporter [Xanthobacteraceae bacterium]